MRLMLNLALSGASSVSGSITTLSMTGLTSGAAIIGDHASLSVGFPVGVTSWTSEAWGVGTYGDTTYGTGANPTDYTASDTLSLLWEGVGDDGNTYRASALIRYAFGTAPAIADGQNWTVDDTSVNIDASASGANLTFTYGLSGVPGTITIHASTGAITGTPTAVDSGTATITATDQYGSELTDTFTWAAALRAQATAGGALANQAFRDDTDEQTYDTSVDFTAGGNTLTYSITSLTGVSIDSSTAIVTFDTNTLALQENTALTVTATDEYARETTSGFNLTIDDVPAQPAPGDWSMADNADGTFDIVLTTLADDNFSALTDYEYSTDNGTVWDSFPSYAGTGTYIITAQSNGAGLANTTYTCKIRAVNARGAGTASASDNVTVTGVATAPVLNSASYTVGSAGNPASLALSYSGTVTGYRVYIATGGNSLAVSAAQLYAGSGGTDSDEFTDYAIGTDIDVTGLTSASESSTQVAVALIKSADGTAPSNIVYETVSGLDFTVPAAPTAATDVAGDTITLTFAEAIYGSQDTADWVLSGAGSNSRTISSVSGFGTSSITLELSGAVVSGALALAYTDTDSDLRDASANGLADFTGLTVTNNLAAGTTFTDDFSGFTSGDNLEGSANYTEQVNLFSGKIEVNASAQITLESAAGSNDSQTLRYTGSLSGDQYAQIDLVDLGASTTAVNTGLYCCCGTIGDDTYYQLRIYGDGNYNLRRRITGTNTALATGSAGNFAAGDTAILERDSTNNTVSVKRIRSGTPTTLVNAVADSGLSSGAAGLGIFQSGASTTTPIADNFECGDL